MNKNQVAILMVTCCLEQSRLQLMPFVIDPLKEHAKQDTTFCDCLTIFDNASTQSGIYDLLLSLSNNVHVANRNVGYWSAIDWWLDQLSSDPPEFTYIIESDMVHYDLTALQSCIDFLSKNHDVGSVRLHEYSVSEKHLYNKDSPRADSRRNLWQSHTNRVTQKPVCFEQATDKIWKTTFLTQLPALNRFVAMKKAFASLKKVEKFAEPDFQKLYWEQYQSTGIYDGGIFHCNLNPYGTKTVTGSWTDENKLKQLGYQPTRNASLLAFDQYDVKHI